jgi:hypothetical protein
MSRAALEKRKAQLEQERARAEALLYRLQGAITLVNELLDEEPEPESE